MPTFPGTIGSSGCGCRVRVSYSVIVMRPGV
jgi:hypothetical protein